MAWGTRTPVCLCGALIGRVSERSVPDAGSGSPRFQAFLRAGCSGLTARSLTAAARRRRALQGASGTHPDRVVGMTPARTQRKAPAAIPGSPVSWLGPGWASGSRPPPSGGGSSDIESPIDPGAQEMKRMSFRGCDLGWTESVRHGEDQGGKKCGAGSKRKEN